MCHMLRKNNFNVEYTKFPLSLLQLKFDIVHVFFSLDFSSLMSWAASYMLVGYIIVIPCMVVYI